MLTLLTMLCIGDFELIILDRCGQLPGAVGYIMYTIEPALLYDLCVR